MTVAVPSTPANYFHLLRRHVLDGVHRPMVVFTPKSMLRNKAAVSSVADFTDGKFESVIADHTVDPADVADRAADQRQALLRAGRLPDSRTSITDTAIVRLEQIYPVPRRKLAAPARRLPERHRLPLGAGGAGQPGRLDVPGAGAAGDAAQTDRHQAGAPAARWPRRPPGPPRVHEVEQAAVITAAFAAH